tara:strand:+ start:10294 stop:12063 length:1770 start_codon:yes stop_codon:yes gene_type:complete
MRNKESIFIYFVVVGIFFSICATCIYFSRIENKLTKDFIGMNFVLQTDKAPETTLLFTYKDKFSTKYVLNDLNPSKDTLYFAFPKSDIVIKKFRLDFGNDPSSNPIKIKELRLIFTTNQIVVDEENIIQKLFNTSAAVNLDKKERIINFNKNVAPFDPYIIFSPLVEFTLDQKVYAIYLLGPIIVLLLVYFLIVRKTLKINLFHILLLLFISCIPLKIAWTTFLAILIAIYGLLNKLNNKEIQGEKYLSLLFLWVFIALVLFGRPTSFSDIDMQVGFLLWALIGFTLQIPKIITYKIYTTFFIILNVIIVVSGCSFLFWFEDFYGLAIADYFTDIKLYGRDIRNWLYYDHAAFLSFFGIIGIIFIHELFNKKFVNLLVVWLYHLILIAFIFITATRVGFFIYLFVLLNVLITFNYKTRIIVNTFILVVFSTCLFSYINEIDKSRSVLWDISWEAIKTKPFFGYGVGQSNKILQNAYNNKDSIGAPLLELNHSHNQYLTYLLELGFVGVFFLLLGLFIFLFKTKQYKNNIMIIFLFALSFLFLTESALQTSKPFYILSFLFWVLIDNNKLNKPNLKLGLFKQHVLKKNFF